mgnify:FL=1
MDVVDTALGTRTAAVCWGRILRLSGGSMWTTLKGVIEKEGRQHGASPSSELICIWIGKVNDSD